MRTVALLAAFCLSIVAVPVYGQNWAAIKADGTYLWGEGWGTTVAEADKQALNDLISKISLQVTGSVSHDERETASNSGVETSSTFRSSVSTYSAATLVNTEKIIIENEPDAHVGRWIKRSDIDKIFEGRKNKISDYISSATRQSGKARSMWR